MQIQNGHITIMASVGKRTYNATFEILGGGLVAVESGGRTLDIGKVPGRTLEAIERAFDREMANTREIIHVALVAWARSSTPTEIDGCESLLLALAELAGCHPGAVRMQVPGYPLRGVLGDPRDHGQRAGRPCTVAGAATCSNNNDGATVDGTDGKVVDLRAYVRAVAGRATRDRPRTKVP